MDLKIEPLMAQFGAAVHDAQLLEHCLELIHVILNETARDGEKLPEAAWLYGENGSAGLGRLIHVLRRRIFMPEAANEDIEIALKTRNLLVHAHFKSERCLMAALTEAGTQQLMSELRDIRAILKQATASADEILNKLLARHGTFSFC